MTRYKKYKEVYKKYQLTEKAFIINMYFGMLRRTKYKKTYRGKDPTFTLNEFREWLKNTSFEGLYSRYKAHERKKRLAPSIDRVDNDKGYDLDNIRIITQSMNSSKGNSERKHRHGRYTEPFLMAPEMIESYKKLVTNK